MPGIAKVEEIPRPDNEISWDKREYPSPDGIWVAVFRDPIEFHMGAYRWSFSLVTAALHTSVGHSVSEKLSAGRGLKCPDEFQPWRHDSRMLALPSWERGLCIWDVGGDSFREVGGAYWSAQWAPDQPRLLVFGQGDRIYLLGGEGGFVSRLTWESAENEWPTTGWLRNGGYCFVLGRSSKRAQTKIAYFHGEDGEHAGSCALDPVALAPYDVDRYKGIHREGYTLVLGGGTRAVGSLLDRWNTVRFDPQRNALLLSVYRPVNAPYRSGDQLVCDVQEKWLAVTLTEE